MNWLELLKNRWIQLGAGAVLAFAVGFLVCQEQQKPIVQIKEKISERLVVDQVAIEKAVSQAREEWAKNTKEHIIIKTITKPSGETIVVQEVIKEAQESHKTEKVEVVEKIVTKTEIQEKTVERVVNITSPLKRFSLGLAVEKPITKLLNTAPTEELDYRVNGSIRVLGEAWLDTGYSWKAKIIELGVSFHF